MNVADAKSIIKGANKIVYEDDNVIEFVGERYGHPDVSFPYGKGSIEYVRPWGRIEKAWFEP